MIDRRTKGEGGRRLAEWGGMESQGDVSLSPITKLGYGSHSESGGGQAGLLSNEISLG